MDPTVTELQSQIDRLSLAVRHTRDTPGRVEPVERQLSLVADRCAEILNRWTEADQRHAQAIAKVEARFGEWDAVEGRLEQRSLQGLRELTELVEHEWKALRQAQEEPIKQLREHASAVGEIYAKAAHLALQGFERAEARFLALESDLQGQLGQLSRDVQATLAELRRDGARPALVGAEVAPFPIEGVMRIHDELREPDSIARPDAPIAVTSVRESAGALQRQTVRQLPEATALSDRIGLLEREVTSEREEMRETSTRADRMRRDWRVALGVLGAAVVVVGVLGLRLQQRVEARLDDAATRVEAAEQQAETATREIASARADADRQIAEAHDAAAKADIVSGVLAAPDLLRFNLTGTAEAEGASAQALWSRSRGLVLSARHLPVAAAGSIYQVWLLAPTGPFSAATFVTDATGRVTMATDSLQNIPRPITGATVTLERAVGLSAPTGPTVLARVQP